MFIKTDRLLLRPPWGEDAPAIWEGIAHWDIVSNLARAPWPYMLDDAETFVRMATDWAAAGSEHALVMTLLPEARVIGCAGLANKGDGVWEIGYWLARPWWGRGLASEAAAALLETGFLGLGAREIRAGHFLDNPASGRVQEKLGFEAIGTGPRWCAAREDDVPARELCLTRAKWLAHREHSPMRAAVAA